jgi:hypothetical protein
MPRSSKRAVVASTSTNLASSSRKRREGVLLGLLQHYPGRGGLAHSWRPVDDNVLGIGPAQRGPQGLEPIVLPNDLPHLLGRVLLTGALSRRMAFSRLSLSSLLAAFPINSRTY